MHKLWNRLWLRVVVVALSVAVLAGIVALGVMSGRAVNQAITPQYQTEVRQAYMSQYAEAPYFESLDVSTSAITSADATQGMSHVEVKMTVNTLNADTVKDLYAQAPDLADGSNSIIIALADSSRSLTLTGVTLHNETDMNTISDDVAYLESQGVSSFAVTASINTSGESTGLAYEVDADPITTAQIPDFVAHFRGTKTLTGYFVNKSTGNTITVPFLGSTDSISTSLRYARDLTNTVTVGGGSTTYVGQVSGKDARFVLGAGTTDDAKQTFSEAVDVVRSLGDYPIINTYSVSTSTSDNSTGTN